MSKYQTVNVDVSKLRAGDVIEFTATARVLHLCAANDDDPTLGDVPYVMQLVGSSGLYNGRKVKVKCPKNEKVKRLLRNPLHRRFWEWFIKKCWSPK